MFLAIINCGIIRAHLQPWQFDHFIRKTWFPVKRGDCALVNHINKRRLRERGVKRIVALENVKAEQYNFFNKALKQQWVSTLKVPLVTQIRTSTSEVFFFDQEFWIPEEQPDSLLEMQNKQKLRSQGIIHHGDRILVDLLSLRIQKAAQALLFKKNSAHSMQKYS